MKKKKIIDVIAQELVDGINKKKKESGLYYKISTIETLFDCGVLGLLTPVQLVRTFYNTIVEKQKQKHA